jgi:erythromycin esterase-like protein
MAQNATAIAEHVGSISGRPGKMVVWAHNSHVGDARATGAVNRGELNLGQLMRQRHGAAAFLLGFLTYDGGVMAATEWDAPGRVFDVRPALKGSYADVFHSSGVPAFSLVLRGRKEIGTQIGEPRLERAIGVVYVPQSERLSHYFEAVLSDQFDAVMYFDRTGPVKPLR